MQWKILDRVPSQIEGLRMRREEAAQKPKGRTQAKSDRLSATWHEPNPWLLGFVVTVIVGVVVAVILSL